MPRRRARYSKDLSELLLDLNGKWADVSAHLTKVQLELLSAVAQTSAGGR